MDDYLSEREQWERLLAWLRSNGLWIFAGILVGIGILLGMRWWDARADRLALEAGAKYEQILEALNRGDKTRAQTLTTELERDHKSSPYTDQARLVAARVAVEAGELDKASATLKTVVESTKDEQLALVARLRLARLQVALGKPDEALTTLDAVDPGAFKPRYQEARGDALLAKGDKAGALKEYQGAQSGVATRAVDSSSLELKIQDLLADTAAAPAAPPVAADTQPAEAK